VPFDHKIPSQIGFSTGQFRSVEPKGNDNCRPKLHSPPRLLFGFEAGLRANFEINFEAKKDGCCRLLRGRESPIQNAAVWAKKNDSSRPIGRPSRDDLCQIGFSAATGPKILSSQSRKTPA
jgi:hypothetical protein